MINDVLKSCGLTEKESQLYIELLEIGSQPASVIARRMDIPRSTAQYLAETLVKKNFANKVIKNKITYYLSKNPNHIKNEMELQKKNFLDSLKNKSEKLDLIIPLLEQIQAKNIDQTKVQYFERYDGIVNMFEDVLIVNEPVYGILGVHNLCPKIKKYLESSYTVRRKKQITSKSKTIFLDEKESMSYMKNNYDIKKFESVIVDKKFLNIDVIIQIYGNKVAFYSVKDQSNLHGILIESKTIVDTLRSIFLALFNIAELNQKKIRPLSFQPDKPKKHHL